MLALLQQAALGCMCCHNRKPMSCPPKPHHLGRLQRLLPPLQQISTHGVSAGGSADCSVNCSWFSSRDWVWELMQAASLELLRLLASLQLPGQVSVRHQLVPTCHSWHLLCTLRYRGPGLEVCRLLFCLSSGHWRQEPRWGTHSLHSWPCRLRSPGHLHLRRQQGCGTAGMQQNSHSLQVPWRSQMPWPELLLQPQQRHRHCHCQRRQLQHHHHLQRLRSLQQRMQCQLERQWRSTAQAAWLELGWTAHCQLRPPPAVLVAVVQAASAAGPAHAQIKSRLGLRASHTHQWG